MHMHYQTDIERNQLIFAHHATSNYSGIRRRFVYRQSVRELIRKTRETAIYCLTTLAVATLFLGGTYFFLVQLANYGW